MLGMGEEGRVIGRERGGEGKLGRGGGREGGPETVVDNWLNSFFAKLIVGREEGREL